jgi:ferrous-iron efflux pump FieF
VGPATPAATRGAAPLDSARVARLMRLATAASVLVAIVLIAVKLGAWVLTDSVSVLSSLLDSLLDALASLTNFVAVRHALTPADREHRWGHGKAESLSGLAQATFIGGSAMFLFLEAGRRFIDPHAVESGGVGIAVMIFSIVLTLALVMFQRHVVRATKSVAVRADALHYASDLLLNASVIVSLVLSMWLGWAAIDPLFGIGLGLFIMWSAYQIAIESLQALMDRELPDEERAKIRSIALRHPEVRDIHDLRSRRSGMNTFIQFHLEMDANLSLKRAHDIADQVETEIVAAFPNAEVMIHEDPEGVVEQHKTFAPG